MHARPQLKAHISRTTFAADTMLAAKNNDIFGRHNNATFIRSKNKNNASLLPSGRLFQKKKSFGKTLNNSSVSLFIFFSGRVPIESVFLSLLSPQDVRTDSAAGQHSLLFIGDGDITGII